MRRCLPSRIHCRLGGHSPPDCRRGGYTLLEMLLVLAVLAALAAAVWPSVQRVYADYELKQAVEDVRVKLAATRIQAIDSGLIYQFRYEPEGRRFLSVPYEWDMDELEGEWSPSGSLSGIPRKQSGQLPEGMRFQAAGSELFGGQPLSPEWLEGLPDADQLAGTQWSPPQLFRPDGSASDAALDVMDSNRQFIRVWVRGLTGAVTVGAIREEFDR